MLHPVTYPAAGMNLLRHIRKRRSRARIRSRHPPIADARKQHRHHSDQDRRDHMPMPAVAEHPKYRHRRHRLDHDHAVQNQVPQRQRPPQPRRRAIHHRRFTAHWGILLANSRVLLPSTKRCILSAFRHARSFRDLLQDSSAAGQESIEPFQYWHFPRNQPSRQGQIFATQPPGRPLANRSHRTHPRFWLKKIPAPSEIAANSPVRPVRSERQKNPYGRYLLVKTYQ